MDKLRAASKTWVAAILIGFLILSFAIWGINDIFTTRSTTTLAKVGDLELDYRTFEQEFLLRARAQIDSSGRPMTTQEARDIGYDRVVLNDMVRDTAVLNEANRLGLAASDDMVRVAIMEIPGLARPGGGIEPGIFQRFLQQIQMTEAQFVQLLRDSIIRDQIARTAMVGAPAPRGMALALAAYENERRSIEYVVLPADKAGEIAAPDDAALQAYMQANEAAWTTPEMRIVTVMTIDANEVAEKIEVAESEIVSEYEVRRATYETLETRELLQISFPGKAEAEAARAEIDGGKSFEDVATERGFSAEDISLGLVTKGDGTVPAGAFEVGDGEVTQPLEGPFGWVLVKVNKVNAGTVRPLDEVRDELRKIVALERALVEISDRTSVLEEALAAADSLESVPGLLDNDIPARVATLAPMDRAGNGVDGAPVPGLPDGATFLTEAFNAELGETGHLAETPAHILYVLRVDQVLPPALQQLEARRDAVLAAWMLAEQTTKLSAIAAGVEERANAAGGDLASVAEELGLEGKTTEAIARNQAGADLSPAALATLFSTPRGKWVTGPGAEAPSIVLARVREVTTAADVDRAVEREMRATITRDLAGALSDAYQNAILQATKVEIDEALFNQLKQRQP